MSYNPCNQMLMCYFCLNVGGVSELQNVNGPMLVIMATWSAIIYLLVMKSSCQYKFQQA